MEETLPVTSLASEKSQPDTAKRVYGYDLYLLIENILGALLFLLPVFFLPFTFNALELNKTYLVILAAVFSLLLFFIKGLQRKTIRLYSPEAYFGFFIILVAAGLAAFRSQVPRVSFLGSNTIYSASFIYVLALAVLGFVSSNVRLNLKKLVNLFVLGISFGTLISLAAYYVGYVPLLGQVNREFSLSGGSIVSFGLSVFAVFYSFMSLSGLQVSKESRNSLAKIVLYSGVLVLNALYLIAGLNVLSILIILFALAFSVISGRIVLPSDKKVFIVLGSVLVLLSFLTYFAPVRSALKLQNYAQPARLSINDSWLVSASTIREVPITGSGLGTFLIDFTRFRPAALNLTSVWELRFIQPFNEIFLWLATAGLIGLFAYVLFWVFTLKGAIAVSRESSKGGVILLLVMLLLLEMVFLGPNQVLTVFLFILIGVIIQSRKYGIVSASAPYMLWTLFGVGLILAGLFGFQVYRVYPSQYYFRQSAIAPNIVDVYQLQRQAIAGDPYEELYRSQGVLTNLFIATNMSQAENLTDTDKTQILDLVTQAANDAKILTQLVNPLNVTNWDVQGRLYDALIGTAENADQFAVAAYSNTVQLDPTNPKNWIQLGSVYYRQKQYGNAIQAFSQAVSLKNDYANAHYNLAFALKDVGYVFDAVTQLEIVERLIPQDHPDHEAVANSLKDFRKLAEETAKKIQEEQAKLALENQSKESVAAGGSIEPLTKPGTEPAIEPAVEIPQDAIDPGSADTDQSSPAPADGRSPDKNQGETDAPIANPPE